MVGIKDTHFWSTHWYRNIIILDLNPSICDKSHSCLSIWTVDLSSLYRLDIQFVQNGDYACEWRFGGGCVCEPSVYIWVPANSLSAGVCEDWIVSYSSRSQKHQTPLHQLVPETKPDNSNTRVTHTHTKIFLPLHQRNIFLFYFFYFLHKLRLTDNKRIRPELRDEHELACRHVTTWQTYTAWLHI